MISPITPYAGSLLVSEPFMQDHNFRRSVIYLTAHETDGGDMGFIINQPAGVNLSAIFSGNNMQRFQCWYGGPVAANQLFFVHRASHLLSGGMHIANGVFMGGEIEHLLELITGSLLQPEDIKFFIGYSGWSPGQLNTELEENSWLVSHLRHTDTLFEHDADTLWKNVVIDMGPKIAHIANFPSDPHLN